MTYQSGEVVAAANGPVTNKMFLVKSGEVVLVPADVPLPGEAGVRLCVRVGGTLALAA